MFFIKHYSMLYINFGLLFIKRVFTNYVYINNSKIRFTFFRIFQKIKINLLSIKWKKLKLNKK